MDTRDGGKPFKKSMMNYSPPVGPIGLSQSSVGLGGDNHGCGCDGSNEHMTGTPGNHGTNHGNCGSQGRR